MKNIDFTTAVSSFTIVCNTLYYKLKIISLAELRNSEYYNDYCIAAYNLAKAMVYSSVHHKKILHLASLEACEEEDMVNDLCIIFIEKFNTIIKAMINYGDNHSHKNYTSSMVSSHLIDRVNKYLDKTKEDSSNKLNKKEKNYLSFSSLNTTLKENDDFGSCFLDLLESQEKSPEDVYLDIVNQYESQQNVLALLKIASKHKCKGTVLSLFLFGLKSENLGGKVQSSSEKIYSAVSQDKNYFINYYRKVLKKYNDEVLRLDESLLKPYLEYTLTDFGYFDMSSPKAIAAKLSRWNTILKYDLAREYKISLSHQERCK